MKHFALASLILMYCAISADALSVNWIVLDGTDKSFCSEEVRSDAIGWLQRTFPRERIKSDAPRHIKSDTGIESLMELVVKDWTVIYVHNREIGSMGRMIPLKNGRSLILMNTERLSFGKGISSDREKRLLRHEFAHAMGLVAGKDHLMVVDGRHCTDPGCLLYGRVRAIDILAGILPSRFARRQPDELCKLCLRDLKNMSL